MKTISQSVGINPAFQSETEPSLECKVPSEIYAVAVRHAHLQYRDVVNALISGTTPTTQVVLKDFNMTVKRGHIYGLLGASGCGKTSILRAIVGQQSLTAGQIRVLGHEPGTRASGIPGTTVGYMPQEYSLSDDFTIEETLSYYGRLGGMNTEEIKVQRDYLVKLLDLPNETRTVGTLSGGQQRRVSLAVAVLYSPPILILDEPTVGVDPLLRESIWEYMINLARTNGTTVLITTHYIEEATQADTVGLMRHGKLMAEQNPQSLIQTLECNSLEDVLLKLCLLQSTKEQTISSVNDAPALPELPKVNEDDICSEGLTWTSKRVSSMQRLRALLWKDYCSLTRQYAFLLFILFLPAVCCLLFVMAIGKPPTGIHISVFNQETNCYSNGTFPKNLYISETSTAYCKMPSGLSCRILALFEGIGMITLVSDTEKAATEHVRKGRAWAAVTFGKNFTSALMERAGYLSPFDVDVDIIEQGSIGIVMDQSDAVISTLVQTQLVTILKQVLGEVDDACHNLKHMKDLPIQNKPPVYGSSGTTFTDFVIPASLSSLMLVTPLITTMSFLLPEKLRGTLERGLVVGVTMSEVVLSQFIICLIPTFFNIATTLYVPYGLYRISMSGSYWSMFVIMFFDAIVGMNIGFVLALISKSIETAFMTGLGFHFTCLTCGGTIWPLEGAHQFVRFLSWIFPMTLPTTALRNVALRGWTLHNSSFLNCMMSTAVWSAILLAALILIGRVNR